MIRPAAAMLLLALASCATPREQLGTALKGAGLSPRVAECMADRMVERLSVGQLLKLRTLGGADGGTASDLSASEFLRRVRAMNDPEIVTVATSSLAVCGLGL